MCWLIGQRRTAGRGGQVWHDVKMSPTDLLIAAYYDCLSPQDRKELEAWAQFAMEQIADAGNTAP